MPCALQAEDAQLNLVPTIVSGSLSPLRIEIDGKAVVRESTPVPELLFDGEPITPLQQKGSPFFVSSTGNQLNFDSGPRHWEFDLPSAELLSNEGGKLTFQVFGADTLRLDGRNLPLTESQATWTIPAKLMKNILVMEVRKTGKAFGRVYNLEVSRAPRQVAAIDAVTATAPPPTDAKSLELLRFQFAPITAFQRSTSHSTSFQVAWVPEYRISEDWGAGLSVGGSIFHSAASGRKFFLLESFAGVRWQPGNLGVGLGVGAQTWFTFGGTFALAHLQLTHSVDWPLLGLVLDRLILGYTHVFTTPAPTHFLRAGIGARL